MVEESLTNTNQLVECARGVSRGRVWGVFEGVSVLCVRVCLGVCQECVQCYVCGV